MCSGGIFDYAHKKERLAEVELELGEPGVWDDPDKAQALGKERAALEAVVGTIDELDSGLADFTELLEMALEENDEDTLASLESDIESLESSLVALEFRRMFSGEMDANNCYLDIQAGSGGTEAQDWANMLLRMYLRWGERRGFKPELMEVRLSSFRVNTRLAGCVPKPVFIALCASRPLIRAIDVTPPLLRCLCRRKSTTILKLKSTLPMCARIPTEPAVPVVSTSTKPILRYV